MSFKTFARFPPFRAVLYRLARWRVAEKLERLAPHLPAGAAVLDIGAGNGVLCEALRARGFRVTPVDLDDLSFVPAVRPVIYDGARLPFPDAAFDVALLITVLHHARAPETVLAEAARVADRLVIIEEIYSSRWRKYVTYAVDSLFNLEFFGHPRSNRTDAGWRASFARLGLALRDAEYSMSLGVLERVTYCVGRQRAAS